MSERRKSMAKIIHFIVFIWKFDTDVGKAFTVLSYFTFHCFLKCIWCVQKELFRVPPWNTKSNVSHADRKRIRAEKVWVMGGRKRSMAIFFKRRASDVWVVCALDRCPFWCSMVTRVTTSSNVACWVFLPLSTLFTEQGILRGVVSLIEPDWKGL